MAARETFGALYRGGGRRTRSWRNDRRLSRLRLSGTPSQNAAGGFDLRLRDGALSSRKLERATYESVAFRYIAANDHPDHDTMATFRQRFLKEIEGLFVRVLLLAREMGVLEMGTVSLDGTKINAQRQPPQRADLGIREQG